MLDHVVGERVREERPADPELEVGEDVLGGKEAALHGLEQRPNKRPVMSDLRESGAIEQDADLILLIYREEVYDQNTTRRGIADIIIAKQRNGPIGEIQLTFLGEYTRFENLVAESYGEGAF